MKRPNGADARRNKRRNAGDCVAFCCCFVFWILITGSFSAGSLIRGLIVALVVVFVTKLVFRMELPEDVTPRFLLVRFPMFLAWLGWEIIKANINLALILLRPRLVIDPKIVSFRSALPGDFRNTVLADTITVTPGTLTLDAEGDLLTVHCLAPAHKKGLLEDGSPQRMVRWLFRRGGEPPEELGT